MPQLDATSFPSQLFWLTVSFVVLYVLLSRVLLPQVQSVFALRARTVEGDIEQAEQMKSEAARVSEQYEKSLLEARQKSQTMIAAAQAEIAAHAHKRQAEMDVSMEKKLLQSQEAIYNAKQAVAEKLSPVAGDLASLIVEVLVHQKPSAKDIGAAISHLSKERSL